MGWRWPARRIVSRDPGRWLLRKGSLSRRPSRNIYVHIYVLIHSTWIRMEWAAAPCQAHPGCWFYASLHLGGHRPLSRTKRTRSRGCGGRCRQDARRRVGIRRRRPLTSGGWPSSAIVPTFLCSTASAAAGRAACLSVSILIVLPFWSRSRAAERAHEGRRRHAPETPKKPVYRSIGGRPAARPGSPAPEDVQPPPRSHEAAPRSNGPRSTRRQNVAGGAQGRRGGPTTV